MFFHSTTTRPCGRWVDRHRARHPGPPPFPLRSRGRPGGSPPRRSRRTSTRQRGPPRARGTSKKIFGGSGEGKQDAAGTEAANCSGREGGLPSRAGAATSAPSAPRETGSMAPVKKWSITALGVLLIWSAIGFGAYALAWQAHSHHAGQVLLQSEHAAMAKIAHTHHGAACVVSGQQPGQLSGIL